MSDDGETQDQSDLSPWLNWGTGVGTILLDMAAPGLGSAVAVAWGIINIFTTQQGTQDRQKFFKAFEKKIVTWVERYVKVALDEAAVKGANEDMANLFNQVASHTTKCWVETSPECCQSPNAPKYCNSTSRLQAHSHIDWKTLDIEDAKSRYQDLTTIIQQCDGCLGASGGCKVSNRKLLSTPTPVLPVFINYVTMCLGLYREAWQAVHRVDGLDNANRNYWAKVLTRQINDNIETVQVAVDQIKASRELEIFMQRIDEQKYGGVNNYYERTTELAEWTNRFLVDKARPWNQTTAGGAAIARWKLKRVLHKESCGKRYGELDRSTCKEERLPFADCPNMPGGSRAFSTRQQLENEWQAFATGYKERIMNDLNVALDKVTAPARSWKWFDPNAKKCAPYDQNAYREYTEGPFGYARHSDPARAILKMPRCWWAGCPPTRVGFWANEERITAWFVNDNVVGVTGDAAVDTGGNWGGQAIKKELILTNGERIVEVHVRAGDEVWYAMFRTNMNRTIEGGGPDCSDNSEGSDPFTYGKGGCDITTRRHGEIATKRGELEGRGLPTSLDRILVQKDSGKQAGRALGVRFVFIRSELLGPCFDN